MRRPRSLMGLGLAVVCAELSRGGASASSVSSLHDLLKIDPMSITFPPEPESLSTDPKKALTPEAASTTLDLPPASTSELSSSSAAFAAESALEAASSALASPSLLSLSREASQTQDAGTQLVDTTVTHFASSPSFAHSTPVIRPEQVPQQHTFPVQPHVQPIPSSRRPIQGMPISDLSSSLLEYDDRLATQSHEHEQARRRAARTGRLRMLFRGNERRDDLEQEDDTFDHLSLIEQLARADKEERELRREKLEKEQGALRRGRRRGRDNYYFYDGADEDDENESNFRFRETINQNDFNDAENDAAENSGHDEELEEDDSNSFREGSLLQVKDVESENRLQPMTLLTEPGSFLKYLSSLEGPRSNLYEEPSPASQLEQSSRILSQNKNKGSGKKRSSKRKSGAVRRNSKSPRLTKSKELTPVSRKGSSSVVEQARGSPRFQALPLQIHQMASPMPAWGPPMPGPSSDATHSQGPLLL